MEWREEQRKESMYFQEKESDSLSAIRELKERQKPVYIYGVGKTAERVRKKLVGNGIDICGHCVDKEFLSMGEGDLGQEKDYPVFSFDDIMELPEADLVIGFYQFGLAYSKIENGEICNRGKVFFINPDPLFNYEYYHANKEKFQQTYDWLADDLSKDTMRAYMDGRMNGVMRPLSVCYVPDQYFIPEIQFASNEVYIDCGMYDGDTIAEFINRCPEYRHIIGFEPDDANIKKIRLRNLPMEHIEVHCAGVWSEETELRFSADGSTASRVVESGDAVLPVMSIDSLNLNEPVTFIKMDIEGSELEALKGARKTIQRDMPKLAICVYHRKEDLISIPQYIKSMESADYSYAFYLRHHSLYEHETVLYAIPVKSEPGNKVDYLISVIIPCYNAGNYLETTITLLKRQSIGFEKLECIFIDDCSEDRTADIILKYQNAFPENIRLIRAEEKLYAGGAKNLGLEYARAPYVSFCDADDLYFEDTLRYLYTHMIEGEYDVVRGNYMSFDRKEKSISTFSLGENDIVLKLDDNREGRNERRRLLGLLMRRETTAWNKLYGRKFLLENQIRFGTGKNNDDQIFSFLVLCYAEKIYFGNQCIYGYRKNVDYSLSNLKFEWDNVKDLFDAMDEFFDICSGRGLLEKFEYEIGYTYLIHTVLMWGEGRIDWEQGEVRKLLFDRLEKHGITWEDNPCMKYAFTDDYKLLRKIGVK